MGSGLIQPTHIIILLAVALLVLGPKRLPEAGKSIGEGLKSFKASLNDHDDEPRRASVDEAPAKTRAED